MGPGRVDDLAHHAANLLVYPVLTRDRQAMADLVQSAVDSLANAHGARIAAGAAHWLSPSVRALTYRLEHLHTLVGASPADPNHRSMLHAAWIGAQCHPGKTGATRQADRIPLILTHP